MKKILALLLVLVLVFSVVACSKPEEKKEEPKKEEAKKEETKEESAEGKKEEPAGEKTEINFAVQADPTKALEAIVKAYNEKSDKYTVKVTTLTNDSGQMHDQIQNSLSSKSGEYDVISMDVVWAGEFAAAGYLQPLDKLLKDKGWLPTDFNAGSMQSGKYKGKNYVLPYFPDLGFLYFRKDIVSEEDAAKLVSGDYTYDDLFAMAEKYKGEKDTKYGFVYQSKQYEGLTCNLNEFSNNWKDVSKGVELMKKFADSDVTPDDITNYTEGETHNAFMNGESVFARNWPYMNGIVAEGKQKIKSDQLGYAPLPNGGTVGGWILGVNVNSKNLEGAEDFLSFLAGPEGQKINATVGSYLPGFNKLLEDKDVLDKNALLKNEGFKNALAKTIARPVVANYQEVSDIIQTKAHKYLTGNEDLKAIAKSIEEALNNN